MSENYLNHELTPDNLRALNAKICECIAKPDEPSGFELFNALITERDVLIQSILASEDTEFVKKFAELELVVNNELKGMAQSLLKSAKDDVSRFIRSQAAIKKYK